VNDQADPSITEFLPGVYERRPRRRDACRLLNAASEGETPLSSMSWEVSGGSARPDVYHGRRLLLTFLRRGWIEFIREWPEPSLVPGVRGTIGQRPITAAEAATALTNDSEWEGGGPWPEGGAVAVSATEAGEAMLAKHLLRRRQHLVGWNY
jgi:hypothetical protein